MGPKKKLKEGPQIPLPPNRKKLQLEAEGFRRRLREIEASGKSVGKSVAELATITEEFQKRKDLFRLLTGVAYELPYCVDLKEKESLSRIFFSLNGSSWKTHFGWSGLLKSQTKPDIKVMEGESSVYDGLTLAKFWSDRGTVLGINLSGIGAEGNLTSKNPASY